MIPEEKIAEIRESARISEFIAPHVALKRRGRSLVGLCPFHNEKTPSFTVDDERGFFHCFGCAAGGNVFKFLMLAEKLSFPEAVRKVADRYGITVVEEGGRNPDERESMFAVNASAARYFRRCLRETPAGKPVLGYLGERGLDDDAIERFALGAAPSSGDGLVRWFRRESVDFDVARRLGLIAERAGRSFDRFRGRLMFPIRDAQGRVVGFGGRALGGDGGPKYLNSPESLVYRKGRVLYGIYEGREALRAQELAILVEGYFDVIALHSAGIEHAVATCGTALTEDQARMLRRHASGVVTLFDADAAGLSAAARSFPLFVEAGLWPKGAFLPDGEDPDTFVRTRGADALRHCVERAVPLVDAYVRHIVANVSDNERGMAEAASKLTALLDKVDDAFARDLLIRKTALWTGVSEEVLRANAPRRVKPTSATPRRKTASGGLEEALVVLLLHDTSLAKGIDDEDVIAKIEDPTWKALADTIVGLVRRGQSVDVGALLESLDGESRARISRKLVETDMGDRSVRERMLADCIARLDERARRRHNAAVLEDLRRQEQLGLEPDPQDAFSRWRPRNRSDA